MAKSKKQENESSQTPELSVLPPPEGAALDVTTQHIFECARIIQNCSDAEIKHYVASCDFITRELILMLAKAWPECLRIAKKVGEDGDKAELAKISVGIKFDLTNMGMLKVDMALDVAPYKLRLPASVEEDLAQMKLDFAAGTIEHCAPEVVEHGEPGPVGDGGEAGDETQSGGESGED